jgi:hypothetical protein
VLLKHLHVVQKLNGRSYDTSLIEGWGHFLNTDRNWNDHERLCEIALKDSSDDLMFALRLALDSLITGYIPQPHATRSTIITCLTTMQEEWFSPVQNEWLLDCFGSRDMTQYCVNWPRLLLLLIDAGAPIFENNLWHQNKIVCAICSLSKSCHDVPTRIGILSILIEKGVGVNEICVEGLTPSMYAQHHECWDEWCEALQRAGKQIHDVLNAEGNVWLLGSDWQKVWRERRYVSWWVYGDDPSASEDDEEDETFDGGSEAEESDYEESGKGTSHEKVAGWLMDNRLKILL